MAGKDAASRLSPLGKPYSDLKHIVNADGQHLYCKYWEPENEPKALAVVVHGMGEHCERYDRIALSLTKHGVLVLAHDHVGHGQSEGTRLDVKSIQIYVRDLFQHIDMIKSKYPKLPLFMIGHSMGGTIAILAAYERSSLFTGIVLSSPGIDVDPAHITPFKLFMAKVLGNILPQVALGGLDPNDVSRNPEHRKAYLEDPLVYHGGVKARIVYQALRGMKRIKNGLADIRWPFLLQHGDHDKLCEISGSRLMYEKAASKDKTLTVYEGCYHELDKELEEDACKVVGEIEEWILKRLPAAGESGEESAEPMAEPAAEQPTVEPSAEPVAEPAAEPSASETVVEDVGNTEGPHLEVNE